MDQTDKYGVPLCDLCEFKDRIIEVEKAEDYIVEDERLCSFIDDDECRATFVYGYQNATGKLQVWVQKTKECPVVVDILGIVLGVIGAIVAIGLFLILMWKIFTTIHDRREFARFEKERMLAKWDTVSFVPIFFEIFYKNRIRPSIWYRIRHRSLQDNKYKVRKKNSRILCRKFL